MTERDLARIRDQVLAASTYRHSFHHGEQHWRAVAHTGLELAPKVGGCRPLVIFLFGLCHDAVRLNEGHDPEHGQRGAQLARQLLTGRLDPDSLDLLYRACAEHTTAPPTGEPTIGVCYDADRLQLWRVGTIPNPRFLSTAAARDPAMIGRAAGYHHAAHDWSQLGRLACELAAIPARPVHARS